MTIRAGAVGGLLTPALATGAALGAALALSVSACTPLHPTVAAVSLACAAGVLAVTQGSPDWAAIFVWELARPPWWLLLVFGAAAFSAHLLQRVATARRSAHRRRWVRPCGGDHRRTGHQDDPMTSGTLTGDQDPPP